MAISGRVYQDNLKEEAYFALPKHYLIDSYKPIRRKALRTIVYLYNLEIKYRSFEDDNEPILDASVPYVAMNLFDRFMSRHKGSHSSTAEVCALGCFFLAWQLHSQKFTGEGYFRKHGLNLGLRGLKEIQEKILGVLEFRLWPITPLCFINYYSSLFELQTVNEFQHMVRRVIIQSQGEFGLLGYRPSHIAASAFLAVDSHITLDSFEVSLGVEKEEIQCCLKAIQKVFRQCKLEKVDKMMMDFELNWLDDVPCAPSLIKAHNLDHRCDESVLLKLEVKLYCLEVEADNWQHRSSGFLLLLKNDDQEKLVRLVVHDFKTNWVKASHWVVKDMSIEQHIDSCAWQAVDYTLGTARKEKFCAIFKSARYCQEFVKVMESL